MNPEAETVAAMQVLDPKNMAGRPFDMRLLPDDFAELEFAVMAAAGDAAPLIDVLLAGLDAADRDALLCRWRSPHRKCGKPGPSEAKRKAIEARNLLLRTLRRTRWPTLSAAEAARRMQADALRYRRNRWPRDDAANREPVAEPERTFYAIWTVLGLAIPGWARLQEIVA